MKTTLKLVLPLILFFAALFAVTATFAVGTDPSSKLVTSTKQLPPKISDSLAQKYHLTVSPLDHAFMMFKSALVFDFGLSFKYLERTSLEMTWTAGKWNALATALAAILLFAWRFLRLLKNPRPRLAWIAAAACLVMSAIPFFVKLDTAGLILATIVLISAALLFTQANRGSIAIASLMAFACFLPLPLASSLAGIGELKQELAGAALCRDYTVLFAINYLTVFLTGILALMYYYGAWIAERAARGKKK